MKKLLLTGMLLVFTLLLLACGGQQAAEQPEPEVIREIVTQVVEVTVEGEERVVTQVVEQEVERIVTATPSEAEMEEMSVRTLNVRVGSEPPSLDPSIATDTTSVDIISNTMCGLSRFDPESLEVMPWVATEWTPSEDGLTYTFNLRDDVMWVAYNPQSGEIEEQRPVTAQDFAYGIRRTLNPETAADYAYVYYVIAGAEAYNTGDPAAEDFAALGDAVGVNAVDDTTLEVTFVEPYGFAPAFSALIHTFAQPQEVIEQWGEGWTEAGRIWNCGPFALTSWIHNAELTLEKNPFYFEADQVNIDRIVAPIIVEESTAFSLYEAGDLDTTQAPIADLDRIRSDAELGEQLDVSPAACTYYYGFVTQKAPTDDPLVRRALSAAMDRTSLIENVTKGGQLPAHSFAPPGIFGTAADNDDVGEWMVMEDFGEQLSQAQAWMEEAGYPNGAGLDLLMMHNTSEAHATIAQAVQAMWQEAFPEANITIENQEWGVYLDTIDPTAPVEGKPNVYRLGWCMDYPDQNNWVNDVFNSASGNNSAMFANEEFDALITQAATEQDPATREELYAQAETILVEDEAAIAPIYYYTNVRVLRPYVNSAPIVGGNNLWYLWDIDWDAKAEMMGQ